MNLGDEIDLRETETRVWVFLIVAAFFAPRLILLFTANGPPVSDGATYFKLAISIAHGHGYAFGDKPTAFWPIGYPGFLGILYILFPNTPTTAYVANLILSAIALVCSFFVFLKLHLSVRWTLIGILALALYPNFIVYQNLATSEILSLAMCSIATLFVLNSYRNYQFFLTGVVFGLATLVKSQVLFLPLIAFAYDIATTRGTKLIVWRYLLLGLGAAVVIAPWTLRNYRVMDRFILVQSNGGYNLLQGNNAKNPWGSGADADQFAAEFPGVISDITKPLPDEMGMQDRAKATAMQFIGSHPAEILLQRVPRKLLSFFSSDKQGIAWLARSNTVNGKWEGWVLPIQKLSTAYYITAFVLTLMSSIVFLSGIYRTKAHFFLLFFILYLAGISAVFFGQGRYHFPLIPAFIGCALVTLRTGTAYIGRVIGAGPPGTRSSRLTLPSPLRTSTDTASQTQHFNPRGVQWRLTPSGRGSGGCC